MFQEKSDRQSDKTNNISGRGTNEHGHLLMHGVLWMSVNNPRRCVFQVFLNGALRHKNKVPQLS